MNQTVYLILLFDIQFRNAFLIYSNLHQLVFPFLKVYLYKVLRKFQNVTVNSESYIKISCKCKDRMLHYKKQKEMINV